MLPWNYGFHWSLGTIIFLGAFYTVLVVLVTTMLSAAWRAQRALRANAAEDLRWHTDFYDLPARDRACRHELTGEVEHRECRNGFDCRTCDTHQTFLDRRPPLEPGEKSYEGFGMTFPLDRMYHRGHTWVRRERDGAVTIGLDDFGRHLLGTPDSLEMPRKGQRLRLHGPAWRFRKRNLDLRVVSPVAGIVLDTDGPDGEWYLKVRPEQPDLRHLLEGFEVRPWVAREMERLHAALSAAGAPPDLLSSRAGVASIAAESPNACWEAACGAMFLRP
jgi:glycine cleavage system H lipoate-binding protein